MLRLLLYRNLSDTSIYNICAFPYLRQYHIHRIYHVNKMCQWMLCRAFGEIAICIPRQTTSRVPLPEISSMLRWVFLLAICSKIIWACPITLLFRMYWAPSRPIQRIASKFLLRLTRFQLHHQISQIQQFTSVLELTLVTGNHVPRHLPRATSSPPTSHPPMSAVAKLIMNAFGMDVNDMETKDSRVNKRYAGIFRSAIFLSHFGSRQQLILVTESYGSQTLPVQGVQAELLRGCYVAAAYATTHTRKSVSIYFPSTIDLTPV